MKPGMTVLPLASMTWAPGGIATSPLRPMVLNRSPSMTMTELSIGGRPVPSINSPPWITVTGAGAWACARLKGAAAPAATSTAVAKAFVIMCFFP